MHLQRDIWPTLMAI